MLHTEFIKSCIPQLIRSNGSYLKFWIPSGSQLSTSSQYHNEEVTLSKKSHPRKLYIGKLPTITSTEQLRDYFSKWGDVKQCHFVKPKRMSKKSTLYGFVTYKSASQAEACLAEPEHLLLNQQIEVKRAMKKVSDKFEALKTSSGNDPNAGTAISPGEDIVEDLVKGAKDNSQKEELKLDLLKQLLQIKSDTLSVTENKQADVTTANTRSLFSAFDDPTTRQTSTTTSKDRSSPRDRRHVRLGLFNKTVPDTLLDNMTIPAEGSSTFWFDHYYNQNLANFYDKPTITNAYEEAIELTEQGKIYTFPINNEQGMEEENHVPFYKHVFLESKLNEGGWCAKRGPVRNFMIAVCSSLSMNPYLTVSEKEEHITWFRDYFIEKQDLLHQLGINSS